MLDTISTAKVGAWREMYRNHGGIELYGDETPYGRSSYKIWVKKGFKAVRIRVEVDS